MLNRSTKNRLNSVIVTVHGIKTTRDNIFALRVYSIRHMI